LKNIENSKIDILSLLQLKYKNKLNPNLTKVLWVQTDIETYLELNFKNSNPKIEKLTIANSNFLLDSSSDFIYDNSGEPLISYYFNPYENILVNINKFIYDLDDYTIINVVDKLFTPDYEATILKQELSSKNVDVPLFEEQLQLIKEKIINLLLSYFINENLLLEQKLQLQFFTLISELNKLTFELPKNDYEIVFSNETEFSKESYSIVIMLSSSEFKLTEIFYNYEKEIGHEASLHTYFEINFDTNNIKTKNIQFVELLVILNEIENDLNQFSDFKLILN
jgi:hypothetical protein